VATTKKTPITKAQMLPQDTPDRFKLGEIGNLGLSIFNGVSTAELKRELNWPSSINTFKQMNAHGTVNSAMTLFDNIIGKAQWSITPPKDATEEEKKQCEVLESMMHDMEGTWSEFIRDVLSMNIFGFSVHEKVYRKRYTSNGSLYNDGLIGWKKLPIRAQETIEKFIFSTDGNDILGVKQNLSGVTDTYNRFTNRVTNEVVLPRSKVMLFRAGKHRGDPFGKSPLQEAYLAWRFLTALEDLEATSIAKDVSGLPVLSIPPQYLSEDASPSQKAIRQYYEASMRNLQMNQQSAMILPLAYDEVSKQPLFKLELLSADGRKQFDISKVKEYYKNSIVTSLFSDSTIQGQSQVGSFGLGNLKNTMSGDAAEVMIKTIRDVIQRELIKQTYELNNWSTERMGMLDYDNIEPIDLESLSKSYQRYASTGLLELDREVLNAVRESVGIDPLPLDMEVQTDILTGNTSRSGDGMKSAGEGTALAPSGNDTSSNNLENV
jgi:hypothetical protein